MIIYRRGQFVDWNIKKNLLFCRAEDFLQGELVYSLFAEHLCYECQEDQDEHVKGLFHMVRTSPLYYTTVYEIEDNPKDMPLPTSFIEKNFRGRIVAFDREKLLITIRCEDFFFEVECDNISISEGSALNIYWSVVNPKFYSHKYSEEEMKTFYNDSREFINVWRQKPFKAYVSKIERMPSDNDISLKFLNTRRGPENSWRDFETNLYSGIPEWGINMNNEDLSCSIIVNSDKKEVFYTIEKDDFKMTGHNTDRDGGWFVYLRKDYVKGLKKFKTVYDIQDYLVRISKKANVNYKYPGEVPLNCHYPFNYNTFIQFTCNIDEFFSEIEVDDYWTVEEKVRDNVSDLSYYKEK